MISGATNGVGFAEALQDCDGSLSAAKGKEAELLAYLNERMQQALLAAGVQVRSVCVEPDEGNTGICAAVALADDGMKQDAAAVLDAFRLHYRLM
jgi:hypothetical protein